MDNTFGEQLVRFVQAVDYIDDHTFEQIRQQVDDYTLKTLNIQVTRLMIASGQRGRTVLQAYRLARQRLYDPIDIRTHAGEYGGQTAYAYAKQQPLWIVSAPGQESELLRDCKAFQNQWSDQGTPNDAMPDDFPGYRMTIQQPIRTSIILPLGDNANRIFGVINFETTDRLEITDIAKDELQNLAYALATAYQTNLATITSQERTNKSLAMLGKLLQVPLPKLTKPKVFLASSTRADRAVIDVVLEVLRTLKFSTHFELVYWKDMNNPGNINQHLIDELGSCRYGLCYLSEPLDHRKHQYQDNPNVVFEAGMLHGRSDPGSPRPAKWIPIREKNSPTPPFDIASERTILVPRDGEGQLNVEELRGELIDRLQGLISNKGSRINNFRFWGVEAPVR